MKTFRSRLFGLGILATFVGCSGGDGAAAPSNPADAGGDDPGPIVETPVPIDYVTRNEQGGSGGDAGVLLTTGFVLFQEAWSGDAAQRGLSAPHREGVSSPYGFVSFADVNDGGKLKFISNDRGNRRLLIFNSFPSSASALPDLVVGQNDFSGGSANAGQGTVGLQGFADNVHVNVCANGMMFVADASNHRVLGYERVPTVSRAAADFVIGQPNESANAANRGGAVGANTLSRPYASYCHDDKLFVLDRDNARVVVFDPIPTANGASASYAIGQPDLVTNGAACSANRLNIPYELLFVDDTMMVADGYNHRVVVYSPVPTGAGAVATAVIGQSSLTTCQANRASPTPADNTLNIPNSLAIGADGVLAVSDFGNLRVLFFEPPFVTGARAIAVHGQPDFTSATLAPAASAATLKNAKGLLFSADHLFIGDNGNHRIKVIDLPY